MIEEASVYDVAINSPTTHAVNLSAKENNNIFLKREDMQPIFSFKNRGAYNKICLLYTSPSPRDVEESRMPSSA